MVSPSYSLQTSVAKQHYIKQPSEVKFRLALYLEMFSTIQSINETNFTFSNQRTNFLASPFHSCREASSGPAVAGWQWWAQLTKKLASITANPLTEKLASITLKR